MDVVEFLVRGSAREPYRVTFVKQGQNLEARCSCPAGENGQHCKHRIRILRGDRSGLEGGGPDGLELVQQWLAGSALEQALNELGRAEQESDRAKRALSAAKRNVAKAMRTGTI